MRDVEHIRITVFPESPKTQVKYQGDNKYDVFVTAPASDGRANKQAVTILRKSLQIDGQMRIVSGNRKQNKIIEVIKGD